MCIKKVNRGHFDFHFLKSRVGCDDIWRSYLPTEVKAISHHASVHPDSTVQWVQLSSSSRRWDQTFTDVREIKKTMLNFTYSSGFAPQALTAGGLESLASDWRFVSVTKAEMAEALHMDLAALERKSAAALNKHKGQCVFRKRKTPVSRPDNTHCQV